MMTYMTSYMPIFYVSLSKELNIEVLKLYHYCHSLITEKIKEIVQIRKQF